MSSLFSKLLLVFVLFQVFQVVQSWEYDDQDDWPADDNACGGSIQSPINLVDAVAYTDAELSDENNQLKITSTPVLGTIMNNGRTIQFSLSSPAAAQNGVKFGGKNYTLSQLHFHWGHSEHIVDGESSIAEMHLVHFDATRGADLDAVLANPSGDGNDLLVLGFLMIVGEHNDELDTLLKYFHNIRNASSDMYPVPDLLDPLGSWTSADMDFFSYDGSLTTPGCNEVVKWIVYSTPFTLSQEQYDTFLTLRDGHDNVLTNNYREIQALNGRDIRTTLHASTTDDDVLWSCFSTIGELIVIGFTVMATVVLWRANSDGKTATMRAVLCLLLFGVIFQVLFAVLARVLDDEASCHSWSRDLVCVGLSLIAGIYGISKYYKVQKQKKATNEFTWSDSEEYQKISFHE